MTGLPVGGLLFDPDKPFTCCRICGAVFQATEDRYAQSEYELVVCKERRRQWSLKHSRIHKEREHVRLAMSGRWCTPEAARTLAAFGVVPVKDLALDEEVADALHDAPILPTNDAEG